MEFVLISSGILLMGAMAGLVFLILGSGVVGFLAFLIAVVIVGIVYLYYKRRSVSTPFKDIKKSADLISHINFNKITEC